MPTYDILAPLSGDTVDDLLGRIDHHLTKQGSSPPQGVTIARTVGQAYIDTATGLLYVCTATDGATAGGSTWVQVSFDRSFAATVALMFG